MNKPASELIALADRISGHLGPFNFITRAERELVVTALRAAARAGVDAWCALADDTSWVDGRDVVLLANDMEVSARYCAGEWSGETPDHPREYDGAVWSCFDDAFQIEIEECSKDPREWSHNGATHWRRPTALATPPAQPALAATHGKHDGAVLPKRPFAFAVRRAPENGEDQWRLFMDEGEARAEAEQLDGDYECLFRVGDRRSAVAALTVADQIASAVRVWLECPAEKRPSAQALGIRVAEIAALEQSQSQEGK